MKARHFAALCCAVSLLASTRVALAAPAVDALSAGFASPPDSARPYTWWHWMNGNVTRAGITADLEAMKRNGIGGAQMFTVDNGSFPPGDAPYLGAKWLDLTKFAMQEAHRLNLKLTMHNSAGWSSSGGPWVTPDLAMQKVVSSETQVAGPAHFEAALPQPQVGADFYRDERFGANSPAPSQAARDFYRDIAVFAFRAPSNALKIDNLAGKADFTRADPGSPSGEKTAPPESVIARGGVIELTSRVLASGKLSWDVPPGNWTIVRFGYKPTGIANFPAPTEGRGLETDKLSRAATDLTFQNSVQKVLNVAGPLAPQTLNDILVDSYEVGSQNWTPRFREEFRARRGYDLLPFLPVLTGKVVDSPLVSERFLWDFRRTIADLFAENYDGRFAELSHARGLLFSTEPYGNGPFEELQIGATADIPMGEFWINGSATSTAKLASSVAHTNARKFVGAESFTSDDGWTTDPYSNKALGDRMYGDGINRFIFHTFVHQPWLNRFPGMTMGPNGSHLDRNNTMWNGEFGVAALSGALPVSVAAGKVRRRRFGFRRRQCAGRPARREPAALRLRLRRLRRRNFVAPASTKRSPVSARRHELPSTRAA